MAQGDWTDPALGRITFGEYALAWLESRADLKPKTRHQYHSLLGLHVLPTWQTVPLARITVEGLSQWVARLTLGGAGPSDVRQSVFVISAALDHAVRAGRIRSNPARVLGLPRSGRRDYVFLTHRQVLCYLQCSCCRWNTTGGVCGCRRCCQSCCPPTSSVVRQLCQMTGQPTLPAVTAHCGLPR